MLPTPEEIPELEPETEHDINNMSASQLQTELSTESSNELSTGSPDKPYRKEPHQPYKPKSLIRGDVGDVNIITIKQQKIPNEQQAAFFIELERLQELPAYRAAFSTGLQYGQIKHDHLHHDQLPLAPRSWKEMLRHPHKEGFLAAVNKKYSDLEHRNTF